MRRLRPREGSALLFVCVLTDCRSHQFRARTARPSFSGISVALRETVRARGNSRARFGRSSRSRTSLSGSAEDVRSWPEPRVRFGDGRPVGSRPLSRPSQDQHRRNAHIFTIEDPIGTCTPQGLRRDLAKSPGGIRTVSRTRLKTSCAVPGLSDRRAALPRDACCSDRLDTATSRSATCTPIAVQTITGSLRVPALPTGAGARPALVLLEGCCAGAAARANCPAGYVAVIDVPNAASGPDPLDKIHRSTRRAGARALGPADYESSRLASLRMLISLDDSLGRISIPGVRS